MRKSLLVAFELCCMDVFFCGTEFWFLKCQNLLCAEQFWQRGARCGGSFISAGSPELLGFCICRWIGKFQGTRPLWWSLVSVARVSMINLLCLSLCSYNVCSINGKLEILMSLYLFNSWKYSYHICHFKYSLIVFYYFFLFLLSEKNGFFYARSSQ